MTFLNVHLVSGKQFKIPVGSSTENGKLSTTVVSPTPLELSNLTTLRAQTIIAKYMRNFYRESVLSEVGHGKQNINRETRSSVISWGSDEYDHSSKRNVMTNNVSASGSSEQQNSLEQQKGTPQQLSGDGGTDTTAANNFHKFEHNFDRRYCLQFYPDECFCLCCNEVENEHFGEAIPTGNSTLLIEYCNAVSEAQLDITLVIKSLDPAQETSIILSGVFADFLSTDKDRNTQRTSSTEAEVLPQQLTFTKSDESFHKKLRHVRENIVPKPGFLERLQNRGCGFYNSTIRDRFSLGRYLRALTSFAPSLEQLRTLNSEAKCMVAAVMDYGMADEEYVDGGKSYRKSVGGLTKECSVRKRCDIVQSVTNSGRGFSLSGDSSVPTLSDGKTNPNNYIDDGPKNTSGSVTGREISPLAKELKIDPVIVIGSGKDLMYHFYRGYRLGKPEESLPQLFRKLLGGKAAAANWKVFHGATPRNERAVREAHARTNGLAIETDHSIKGYIHYHHHSRKSTGTNINSESTSTEVNSSGTSSQKKIVTRCEDYYTSYQSNCCKVDPETCANCTPWSEYFNHETETLKPDKIHGFYEFQQKNVKLVLSTEKYQSVFSGERRDAFFSQLLKRDEARALVWLENFGDFETRFLMQEEESDSGSHNKAVRSSSQKINVVEKSLLKSGKCTFARMFGDLYEELIFGENKEELKLENGGFGLKQAGKIIEDLKERIASRKIVLVLLNDGTFCRQAHLRNGSNLYGSDQNDDRTTITGENHKKALDNVSVDSHNNANGDTTSLKLTKVNGRLKGVKKASDSNNVPATSSNDSIDEETREVDDLLVREMRFQREWLDRSKPFTEQHDIVASRVKTTAIHHLIHIKKKQANCVKSKEWERMHFGPNGEEFAAVGPHFVETESDEEDLMEIEKKIRKLYLSKYNDNNSHEKKVLESAIKILQLDKLFLEKRIKKFRLFRVNLKTGEGVLDAFSWLIEELKKEAEEEY